MTAWQMRMIQQLIKAGEHGMQHKVLVNSVNVNVSAEEATAFLESLRAEHAVQRFYVDKATFWRATDVIYEID